MPLLLLLSQYLLHTGNSQTQEFSLGIGDHLRTLKKPSNILRGLANQGTNEGIDGRIADMHR